MPPIIKQNQPKGSDCRRENTVHNSLFLRGNVGNGCGQGFGLALDWMTARLRRPVFCRGRGNILDGLWGCFDG